MKKIIFSLLAIGIFTLAQAQQAASPAPNQQQTKGNRPSPEQIATRHSTHLQKTLGLTDDQKQKTYQAILARCNAIDQVRAKYGPSGDKKAMHDEIKPIRTQFVQTMNGILTPDQKTKWDEHRAKMKEHRMKKEQGNPPAQPGGGGPDKAKKLNDDDDGIED